MTDTTPEFTEAEELGLLLVGTLTRLEQERDAARAVAVRLEQDLAQGVIHLERLITDWPDSSWALDALTKSNAEEFLASLRDPGATP